MLLLHLLCFCLLGFFLLLLFNENEQFDDLHDKPESWTKELVTSRDPTAENLWKMSQRYLGAGCPMQYRIPPQYLVGTNQDVNKRSVCK